MPIYEYVCPEHGKFARLRQGFIAKLNGERVLCPKCTALCDKVMSTSTSQNRDTIDVIYRDQGRRMDSMGRPHD